jgi:hypothetical protein
VSETDKSVAARGGVAVRKLSKSETGREGITGDPARGTHGMLLIRRELRWMAEAKPEHRSLARCRSWTALARSPSRTLSRSLGT